VPLCRDHHREVHRFGQEVAWWTNLKIAPLEVAHDLWVADLIQTGRSQPRKHHPTRWILNWLRVTP
jgi:hypothetical protein